MDLTKICKEYWKNASGKTYTAVFPEQLFLELVDKTEPAIDYGCGYGRVLKRLDDLGYENLHGADVSPAQLREAKELCPAADYSLLEEQRTKYPDGFFKAAVLVGVITCVPDFDEQRKIADEVYRILKPGGLLFMSDFLISDDSRNRTRYEKYFVEFNDYGVFRAGGSIYRHHKDKHAANFLKKFKIRNLRFQKFTTMNGNQAEGFVYVGVKK